MILSWKKKSPFRSEFAAQNILNSSVRLPSTVYIVAGGPNGKKYYHSIPDDGYIIAVNQSVLIPEITPDMWVLNSMNKTTRPWIRKAHQSFKGTRVFKQNCVEKTPKYIQKSDHFIYVPNQKNEPSNSTRILPGILRGGGTVSGYAIQIAAHLGARNIILCGVDFSGQTYWDGKTGNHRKHGDVWSYKAAADKIVQDLHKEYDLNITSLSPTKLNIKQSFSPPESS